MGHIPEHIINEVKRQAKISDFISDFIPVKKSGKSLVGDCPKCGGEKKFSLDVAKDQFGCWVCDGAGKMGSGAVSFLMKYSPGMDFITAIRWLADYYKIIFDDVEMPGKEKKLQQLEDVPLTSQRRTEKVKEKSFRDKQLEESGLTEKDQKTMIAGENKDTQIEVDRYVAATLNERYELTAGDDLVMRYVGLDRKVITYQPKGGRNQREFVRVRWAYPDMHKDRHGDSMKYQSPPGSGTKLWFPERLISLYESKAQITTLYIQEGEKKADKATKHGMPSVGIMGIHNMADNKRLPHEFELIVKFCAVKNVVFVVDSDYGSISRNPEKPADSRTRSFLSAAYNFQQYFFAFNNLGINLSLYFAVVKPNEAGAKGLDDLLNGPMNGKEDEVALDIKKTLNQKDGIGAYVDVHNISSWTWQKFNEFFHLSSVQDFAKHYKSQLEGRQVFKFRREIWRFRETPTEAEIVELAQPLGDNEKFYDEKNVFRRGGPEEIIFRFNYKRCYLFLGNRGYSRFKTPDQKKILIHVEKSIVREIERDDIKQYLNEFSEALPEEVQNLLYSGGSRYLSDDSLQNLRFIEPSFQECQKGIQYLYFKNCYWKITEKGISERQLTDLEGHIWQTQIADNHVEVLKKPMMDIEYSPTPAQKIQMEQFQKNYPEGTFTTDFSTGKFEINSFSDDAINCHFLNFILNTSHFYWEKEQKKEKLTDEERDENVRHFLQKVTSIGYLLHTHTDSRVTKAVIAMDGKLSEVGSSNGRSGKSLIGRAIQRVLPTVYIAGKATDLTNDRFLLEEVQPGRTKVLWIDDVRVNFDFEYFFPYITGGAKFETKGVRRTTLSPEQTPKLFICTNHAINGEGSSFSSRMIQLAFSDWYHDTDDSRRTPIDDFGVNFFDEWNYEQWNLFFNFMATCLQLYFKYGIIDAPKERLQKRQLRQFIGEVFLEWAESFYEKIENRNREIPREEITSTFFEKHPEQRRFIEPRKLKKKIVWFCKYKNFRFNPGREKNGRKDGGDIKKGGVEYFIVADQNYVVAKEIEPISVESTQTQIFL